MRLSTFEFPVVSARARRATLTLAVAFVCLITCAAPLRAQQPSTTDTATAPAAAARDERLYRRALRLHNSAILVDGHNDITSFMLDEGYDIATPSAGKYHTDLARLKEGGVTGLFFSVYVDAKYAREGGAARRALDMLDQVHRAAERHPDRLLLATSTADIRSAKKKKRIAALMGIEGGHAIENSLAALRDFYRLGIRYMTLTHNNTNDWADACCDAPRHAGLSDFGREVVSEMNRLGMLIDISHVSDETMADVLAATRAPVIASHSSARALTNHPRNISDEVLRLVARNGGVVMVNFYPVFIDQKVYDASKARAVRLKPQIDELRVRLKDDPALLESEIDKLNAANPLPGTTLSVLVDHIDHIRKVAGVDHVGIGSDYDGVPTLPAGLEDVTRLPNITYELLRRGYTDDEVRKVLGGNLMRAFAQAERVARASGRTISGEGSVKRK